MHLRHALALQLHQALQLLDALFQLRQTGIGLAQGLVPRNEVFLKGLQSGNRFLTARS